MASGAMPCRRPTADGGQDVGDAVLARHGDLRQRQDAAADSGLAVAAPGDGQPGHLACHDPAIGDAQVAGAWSRARVAHGEDLRRRAVAAHHGVVIVAHQRPAAPEQLQQASLDGPVGLHAAVPVEVVGGDVRVDGHVRASRERRQLQLGELQDDPVVAASAPAGAR